MRIDNKNLDIDMAYACLTGNELSKQSGVDIVTLAGVRRGIQETMPKTIGKIAQALKVSVEEIIHS